MQTPLQITADDMTLSETVEAEIREKAAKLERYYKERHRLPGGRRSPRTFRPRLPQPGGAVPREH
ncbi:MAG TPA: hypothetical protein VGX03_34305 [Candidatus Binatia bacterium]|jgi:hypothetical protein|nr:hypothetical protein [Candidatus Binatia bacterium]